MKALAIAALASILSVPYAFGAVWNGPGAPENPTPDGICYFNCPPDGQPSPDPEDVGPGPHGKDNILPAIACSVSDNGLVFRNVGTQTIEPRTRIDWSTDGTSGSLVIAQGMAPQSSWLYAVSTASAKDCAVKIH